jgi:hypothetical protein
MVDPDWSGAVSFGHSACLNPRKEDVSTRLARDKKPSRYKKAPPGRDAGGDRGFCR